MPSSLRSSSSRRELDVRARGATTTSRMSAAAQDAALAAMWATADRRRIGWILGYLCQGVVYHNYRDYAGLPEGSARELLTQFYARYELAQAAALEDLRQAWTPNPVDDVAWEAHAGWCCLTFDGAANDCFRTKSDCRPRNRIG